MLRISRIKIRSVAEKHYPSTSVSASHLYHQRSNL